MVPRGTLSPATKEIRAEIHRLLLSEFSTRTIYAMISAKWGLTNGTVKQYCWAVIRDADCGSREQMIARELQKLKRTLLSVFDTPERYR